MKPFPDPKNNFKWFIEHYVIDSQTGKSTEEVVTSYYMRDEDFQSSLHKYGDAILTFGIYNS
jgi:hypothetical protein